MVTDEERREVAAMLLKVMLEVRPGDEYSAIRRCIYTPEADRHCFGHANRTHWAFGRLAELIEPDPERTCVVEHWGGGVFYLSCGHDSTEHVKPDYCPTCGARVMND